MRRLSIRNLGPVREAEIELGRTNVIIGEAAGKSCVMKAADGHRLFVSTHSPYILSAFVEGKPEDFRLLFLKRAEDGGATVRTATPDDISEINYYGADPFINIGAYNK